MADYDQDTLIERTKTWDALAERADALKARGRHEDVAPSQLLSEISVIAAQEIVDAIRGDQHEGRWIADPEVSNVWGWQPSDYSNRRVGLVYYRADADFELDDEFERTIHERARNATRPVEFRQLR